MSSSRPLEVVALDHFFDQDLLALGSQPLVRLRRIPYRRLRSPAVKILGNGVVDQLDGYAKPDLEPQRATYARWLLREIERIYLERPFDAFVVPSDSFFYVRALPDALHGLGIPLVVMQRETVISPDTMGAYSEVVQRFAPFVSDVMLVCSERHREFWLSTGAPESKILVTGQPRFDIYAAPRPRPARERREVLFLSYQLDAYEPGTFGGIGARTWEPLRSATEKVLIDAVRAGTCRVTIKPHPQQPLRSEPARLRALAGRDWGDGVVLASADADTRELVLGSDVVVGFQTTTMYEAVAAGRPAIYAAWGVVYETAKELLLPLHAAPADCLHQAGTPEQLADLVKSDLPDPPSSARRWWEEALGPIDGRATERVVAHIRAAVALYSATPRRSQLDRKRRGYAIGLGCRSAARVMLWASATPLSRIMSQERRVDSRRRVAVDQLKMATHTLIDRGLA